MRFQSFFALMMVQPEVPLTEFDAHRHRRAADDLERAGLPSEVTGTPILGWTKLVAGLQEASDVDFTLHDLRRTCRTLMSRLGVDTDIAELAIGHKRKGLERLYNFDEAWPLRCDAFAKVSRHIAELLKGAAEEGKVVGIPARA